MTISDRVEFLEREFSKFDHEIPEEVTSFAQMSPLACNYSFRTRYHSCDPCLDVEVLRVRYGSQTRCTPCKVRVCLL